MSRRSPSMDALRSELMIWLAEETAGLLAEHGIDAAIGEQIGCALADHLAEQYGGQVISIPMDYFFRLGKRDLELLAAHRAGEPMASIAMRTRMTLRGVRKLIARAALRAPPDDRQPGLF